MDGMGGVWDMGLVVCLFFKWFCSFFLNLASCILSLTLRECKVCGSIIVKWCHDGELVDVKVLSNCDVRSLSDVDGVEGCGCSGVGEGAWARVAAVVVSRPGRWFGRYAFEAVDCNIYVRG